MGAWEPNDGWSPSMGPELRRVRISSYSGDWEISEARPDVDDEDMVFFANARAALAAERARVRRELLEEFGEPGPVEWRELMKALDRILPEGE